MTIQTVLEVFQERVPKTFAFLVDRHGFSLHRNDDYAFVAKSHHCDVLIELDWGSIVVSVRPLQTGRAVRLSFIVGAKNPTILFLPRYPWGPEDVSEEIDRQADLLLSYCGDILNGDFSQWAALEAHQQQVLEQWRGESERPSGKRAPNSSAAAPRRRGRAGASRKRPSSTRRSATT